MHCIVHDGGSAYLGKSSVVGHLYALKPKYRLSGQGQMVWLIALGRLQQENYCVCVCVWNLDAIKPNLKSSSTSTRLLFQRSLCLLIQSPYIDNNKVKNSPSNYTCLWAKTIHRVNKSIFWSHSCDNLSREAASDKPCRDMEALRFRYAGGNACVIRKKQRVSVTDVLHYCLNILAFIMKPSSLAFHVKNAALGIGMSP